MTATDVRPDATGQIDIAARPEYVYTLVSDPGVLAGLAAEYRGHRWLGGATQAAVGARFLGRNKNGFQRWMTVATITDAEDGARFAFDVTAGPIRSSRWQYDIEATDAGCRVTESTWDRRPGWLRTTAPLITGVKDRAAHNQRNIEATLRALKERAERG
ncbi:MAG: SRPBCC family protein [Haloechinothrix sp.]